MTSSDSSNGGGGSSSGVGGFLTKAELQDLVFSNFPSSGLCFAFAYGSGVLPQTGYNYAQAHNPHSSLKGAGGGEGGAASTGKGGGELPMVDIILTVKDARKWHQLNMDRNASHYSSLARWLGPGGVTYLQELPAGLYYNTSIPVRFMASPGSPMVERVIKYGVISEEQCIADLEGWPHLYIAGRMHKPVRILQGGAGSDTPAAAILSAASVNLQHAVRCALLRLPQSFDEDMLYTAIAGISYAGDFRMGIGENPNKVRNIASGSREHFRELYRPTLKEGGGGGAFADVLSSNSDMTRFQQDMSLGAQRSLVRGLPSYLKAAAATAATEDAEGTEEGAAGRGAATAAAVGDTAATARAAIARVSSSPSVPHPRCLRVSLAVGAALSTVVGRSSRLQAGKGLLSAGLLRSAAYAWAKVRKAARPK